MKGIDLINQAYSGKQPFRNGYDAYCKTEDEIRSAQIRISFQRPVSVSCSFIGVYESSLSRKTREPVAPFCPWYFPR